MRVVAVLTAEHQRTRILRMPELAVRTFPAGNEAKASLLQIGDQRRILRGSRWKKFHTH